MINVLEISYSSFMYDIYVNLNVDREGVKIHLTDEGDLARHRIHHLVVTVNPHTCKFE